jgi:hypothetical protein
LAQWKGHFKFRVKTLIHSVFLSQINTSPKYLIKIGCEAIEAMSLKTRR